MKKSTVSKLVSTLLIAGTLLSTAAVSAEETTVVKAVTGGSPKPYVIVDENNELTGYDIEVLKEVFNRLPQYDLEFEVTDFPSMFSGLTSGNYDLAVNNLSYNEQRAETYLYSYPINEDAYIFATSGSADPIHTFAEASGKTYIGQAGVNVTNAVEVWNEQNPDQAIDISYTDADTVVILQQVQEDDNLFAIIDVAMLDAYTNEFGLDIAGTELEKSEQDIIAENVYSYFLLGQEKADLRDDIDGVLKELKEEGVLSELTTKYFGKDTSPAEDQYEKTIN